uniref:protein-tyrosine-phosphatase n=1 Tax=Globisporangium ultimum (strain ATCC 200006 / CBS 805.95 / DAOM BR144) TaxID=431595 RepID=K3WM16_GLOUD
MPLTAWCAKLTSCTSGDPERIVVQSQTMEHALAASGTQASRSSAQSSSLLDSATFRSDEHDDECDEDEDMLTSSARRLSNLIRRPRVPTISATSLYNTLQTHGVVVIDCRDADEFALRHVHGSLNCTYVKGRKKSVDDVIEKNQNKALACKLAMRDLMEIVVIGANRSTMLYKMDWGYRFARMLLTEDRVHSVKFMAQGFAYFARKYDFLLQTRPSICVGLPTPAAKSKGASESASLQYPNEIVDGFLYLGNFWQANSAKVIAALKITHVINMGATTEDRDKFDNVEYFDVEIPDKVDVDIRKEFEPTIAFIEKAMSAPQGRVLIHCVQGVSRSSTIVIWYVMVTTKCTLSAAYAHVLKCRPLIYPNHGFMQQLMDYEKELYGTTSVTFEDLELLQQGLLPPTDRTGSLLRESFM